MKILQLALVSFVLFAETVFAAPKYDEWVYRDGAVERAEFVCGNPQSQEAPPSFKASEGAEQAVKRAKSYTIVIGSQAPLSTIGETKIVGTFWQLDIETFNSQDNDGLSGYVYFYCGGQKYFAFNVFATGRLIPIMRVGVAEDDTSIFKSAQTISDDLAGLLIDAEAFEKATAQPIAQPQPKAQAQPMGKEQPKGQAVNPPKDSAKTQPKTQPKIKIADVPLPHPRPIEAGQDKPAVKPVPPANKAAGPVSAAPEQAIVAANEKTQPMNSESPAKTADTNEKDAPAPAAEDMAVYDKAALWHGHTNQSLAWTTAAIELLRDHWSQLSKASDIGQFCPGYSSATKKQQEICWLRIIGGIVQFESSFRPAAKFREANGVWSVGLMAMSIGQCPGGPNTIAGLQQALPNLKCGITDFAKWTGEGGSVSSVHGAARNWSTLRNPYTANGLHIGKKQQIQSIAMVYKRY